MGSNYDRLAAQLISLLNGDILPPPNYWDIEHHEQRIAIAVHEATGITPEYWATLDKPSREPWIEKTMRAIEMRNKSSDAKQEEPSNPGISMTTGRIGSGTPDVENAAAEYSLGKLLRELKRSQSDYEVNMKNVDFIRTKLGPIAAEHDRIQAEINKWQPDPVRMPGIDRIELLCNERFGTDINVEAVRRLRADLCKTQGIDLDAANALGLNEVATLLGQRDSENFQIAGTAMAPSTIEIFVSHSSKDNLIASALVDLLRVALNLPAEAIRCTSVAGFKLPGGADTDEQLRREINDSRSFIGLITELSFESAYVLFELGARWVIGKPMVPLLAAGADTSVLKGPIGGKNALSCDSATDLHQLIDNLAMELARTSAKPASYVEKIERLISVSGEIRNARASANSASIVAHQTDVQVEVPSNELSSDEIRYFMSLRRPRNCNHVPIGFFDVNPTAQGEEYRTMIEKFVRLGLMRYGEKTYVFTNIGYKRADRFWRIFVLNRLSSLQKGSFAYVDSVDLAQASTLTNGEDEMNELIRHLRTLQEKGFVDCAEDLANIGALITPEGRAEVRNHPEISFTAVD